MYSVCLDIYLKAYYCISYYLVYYWRERGYIQIRSNASRGYPDVGNHQRVFIFDRHETPNHPPPAPPVIISEQSPSTPNLIDQCRDGFYAAIMRFAEIYPSAEVVWHSILRDSITHNMSHETKVTSQVVSGYPPTFQALSKSYKQIHLH